MNKESPAAGARSIGKSLRIIKRINDKLEPWRSAPAWANHGAGWSLRVPRPVVLTLAVILLILALLSAIIWWRFGGWGPARSSLALLVTGMALLLGRSILRSHVPPVLTPSDSPPNDVSVRWLGYDTNLMLLQTFAFAIMAVRAWRLELNEAWWAAVVAAALMPVLYRSSRQRLSIAVGTLAVLYLVYSWLNHDLSYSIRANAYSRTWSGFVVPVEPIVTILMLLAIIPQLQLLALNSIGIGRLKGDLSAQLFGSTVPIALSSTIVLLSGWVALEALVYAPSWAISAPFS